MGKFAAQDGVTTGWQRVEHTVGLVLSTGPERAIVNTGLLTVTVPTMPNPG